MIPLAAPLERALFHAFVGLGTDSTIGFVSREKPCSTPKWRGHSPVTDDNFNFEMIEIPDPFSPCQSQSPTKVSPSVRTRSLSLSPVHNLQPQRVRALRVQISNRITLFRPLVGCMHRGKK